MSDTVWCIRCHDTEAKSAGMCQACYHADWRRRKKEESLGIKIPPAPSSKRSGRPAGSLARPYYQGTACRPHTGEFDLTTMTPIDSRGRQHMPGKRFCGNADCVNRKHIEGRS